MSFIFGFTQAGVTTFMPLSSPPPPQFLIGFGRIRKLASVRNGGDESPPVHPVAPPLFEGKVVDHDTIAENFVGFENNARP